MAYKIVDITQAREQKIEDQKEERVKSIRDRFSKAMGIDEKAKKKRGSWAKKKKSKPPKDGW